MERFSKFEVWKRPCRPGYRKAWLASLGAGLCCLATWPTWAAFPDDLTACTVQGYVYHKDGQLTFTRVDHCTGVRAEVMDNALLLSSLRRQVAVVPPVTRRQSTFWYHWGRGEAHVSTETIPAASWPIMKSTRLSP
ncbi:MAG: hypothetical protein AB7G48_12245 [Nitrospiraceae bacterium]